MTVVTCPETDCVYNGYGECQLGDALSGLVSGEVSASACPHYEPGEGNPDQE